MPKTVLTKKQRELIIEIRQLLKKHYFDPDEIVREAELGEIGSHPLWDAVETPDEIQFLQEVQPF